MVALLEMGPTVILRHDIRTFFALGSHPGLIPPRDATSTGLSIAAELLMGDVVLLHRSSDAGACYSIAVVDPCKSGLAESPHHSRHEVSRYLPITLLTILRTFDLSIGCIKILACVIHITAYSQSFQDSAIEPRADSHSAPLIPPAATSRRARVRIGCKEQETFTSGEREELERDYSGAVRSGIKAVRLHCEPMRCSIRGVQWRDDTVCSCKLEMGSSYSHSSAFKTFHIGAASGRRLQNWRLTCHAGTSDCIVSGRKRLPPNNRASSSPSRNPPLRYATCTVYLRSATACVTCLLPHRFRKNGIGIDSHAQQGSLFDNTGRGSNLRQRPSFALRPFLTAQEFWCFSLTSLKHSSRAKGALRFRKRCASIMMALPRSILGRHLSKRQALWNMQRSLGKNHWTLCGWIETELHFAEEVEATPKPIPAQIRYIWTWPIITGQHSKAAIFSHRALFLILQTRQPSYSNDSSNIKPSGTLALLIWNNVSHQYHRTTIQRMSNQPHPPSHSSFVKRCSQLAHGRRRSVQSTISAARAPTIAQSSNEDFLESAMETAVGTLVCGPSMAAEEVELGYNHDLLDETTPGVWVHIQAEIVELNGTNWIQASITSKAEPYERPEVYAFGRWQLATRRSEELRPCSDPASHFNLNDLDNGQKTVEDSEVVVYTSQSAIQPAHTSKSDLVHTLESSALSQSLLSCIRSYDEQNTNCCQLNYSNMIDEMKWMSMKASHCAGSHDYDCYTYRTSRTSLISRSTPTPSNISRIRYNLASHRTQTFKHLAKPTDIYTMITPTLFSVLLATMPLAWTHNSRTTPCTSTITHHPSGCCPQQAAHTTTFYTDCHNCSLDIVTKGPQCLIVCPISQAIDKDATTTLTKSKRYEEVVELDGGVGYMICASLTAPVTRIVELCAQCVALQLQLSKSATTQRNPLFFSVAVIDTSLGSTYVWKLRRKYEYAMRRDPSRKQRKTESPHQGSPSLPDLQHRTASPSCLQSIVQPKSPEKKKKRNIQGPTNGPSLAASTPPVSHYHHHQHSPSRTQLQINASIGITQMQDEVFKQVGIRDQFSGIDVVITNSVVRDDESVGRFGILYRTDKFESGNPDKLSKGMGMVSFFFGLVMGWGIVRAFLTEELCGLGSSATTVSAADETDTSSSDQSSPAETETFAPRAGQPTSTTKPGTATASSSGTETVLAFSCSGRVFEHTKALFEYDYEADTVRVYRSSESIQSLCENDLVGLAPHAEDEKSWGMFDFLPIVLNSPPLRLDHLFTSFEDVSKEAGENFNGRGALQRRENSEQSIEIHADLDEGKAEAVTVIPRPITKTRLDHMVLWPPCEPSFRLCRAVTTAATRLTLRTDLIHFKKLHLPSAEPFSIPSLQRHHRIAKLIKNHPPTSLPLSLSLSLSHQQNQNQKMKSTFYYLLFLLLPALTIAKPKPIMVPAGSSPNFNCPLPGKTGKSCKSGSDCLYPNPSLEARPMKCEKGSRWIQGKKKWWGTGMGMETCRSRRRTVGGEGRGCWKKKKKKAGSGYQV
ncbi:uncharacterized protein MYCFIDRAFT_180004 [Pseudocercospora fijiensis CIRAD86]|uniref:Uncharacterized protein n=1 Tax=Pseudocercospora fijiensis (strain CIRAD86) TaxID=383855 RepID=M3AIY2_PSEFD|nr:uncharacterized protein MYCFIDRAFT_180004 [Pseudocercospora fijiensis CIRAD86]EME77437.1 hypothetical protein MYCFIDRAFT_180004 [Pseudocercospora fijiensis CIRAD86]